MRSSFSAPVLSLLVIGTLLAAEPVLRRIEPRGAQRGQAVTLNLVGNGLTDTTRIITEIPGAITKLTPKPGAMSEYGFPYLLEVAPDAVPGAYPFRVENESGISNVLLFTVGAFPEIGEAEADPYGREHSNDDAASAEAIKTPVTVNGTLSGPDRDYYRFAAKAGENLVIEVEARRIGSALDPVIEVRDSAGRPVARNNDGRGIGVDSRLDLKFDQAGEYTVAIHDARFSEQRDNFYRLKLGKFPYAEGIFPLGWKGGTEGEFELMGGNLPAPVKTRVLLDDKAKASGFALAGLPGNTAGLPFPVFVGDGDETMEPQGSDAKSLTPSLTINGRIAKKSEVDRYKLAVSPGESWMIEMQAGSLGTSPLYGLITITDQNGKKIGSAGDQEPEEALTFLRASDDASGDPYVGFEVPKGVTGVTITVEDLLGRGGPEFGYRLTAKKQPADFLLTLATPYVNIPRRGSALVVVSADRRGYMGDISFTVPGLPGDLMVEGGHIPAEDGGMTTARTSRQGILTITPKPGAEARELQLEVWGEGRLPDGRVVRRKAQALGMRTNVAGRGQKDFSAPWLAAAAPARVVEPADGVLEVLTPLHVRLIQGMEHDIKWAFSGRGSGVIPIDSVSVANTPAVGNLRILGGSDIKKGDTQGEFKLITTMGTPSVSFDLVLNCDIRVDGRTQTIYSPAITFDVVQGYRIDPPAEVTKLRPRQSFELAGKFHREPDFLSPVEVTASNLPLNVSCEKASIDGPADTYRLQCRAGEDLESGEYEVELTSSSVLAGRDNEAVPYKIPPVTTKVVVEGATKVAAR